jgi:anti-sigma regulatory factor (Ser/Thr protein kinase)
MGAGAMQSSQLTPIRDWNGIRALRQQLEERLRQLPEEPRRDLAMVAAELAENGLRHSDACDGKSCVMVEVELDASFVELRVTTRLRTAEQAHDVLRRVREIEEAEDKERAYVERLVELSRGDGNATSELGFHRIATEGRCSLCAAHDGDRLTIRARRVL